MAVGGNRLRWLSGLDRWGGTLALAVGFLLLIEAAGAYRVSLDLSADANRSLGEETRTVLARMDGPVSITAFSTRPTIEDAWARDRRVRDLLAVLEGYGVTTHFVDFDARPDQARALGVEQHGTIVVSAAGERVVLRERDLFRFRVGQPPSDRVEALVTGALNRILDDRKRVLYLLAGHGEFSAYRQGQGDLRALGELAETLGIDVRPLNLLGSSAPALPEDADMLWIARPEHPLMVAEESLIRDFLERGGAVAFFVEPESVHPDLLEELGIYKPSGIVLDPDALFPNPDWPRLRVAPHPITASLVDSGVPLVVARGAPLEHVAVAGVTVTPLLRTSSRGWVEEGLPPYGNESEITRAVTVAVAVDFTELRGRLFVAGDADLLRDEMVEEVPGNAAFLTGLLRWQLSEEEALGDLETALAVRRLLLEEAQLSWLRAFLVGGVPAAFALLGLLVVGWRRR